MIGLTLLDHFYMPTSFKWPKCDVCEFTIQPHKFLGDMKRKCGLPRTALKVSCATRLVVPPRQGPDARVLVF
jgi:hypothetical protein